MIWVWGQAADQGHLSWCADINGVVRPREFVQQNNIAWTVIDSAKSVSSAAGWSYSDNDAVRELLRYMREGICQPLNHSISLLSHDGTGNGSHSGAKSWAEDPSMVISLSRALDADGRQVGVTAEFKKDRAAIVDPHRKLTYSLDRENGGFLLSPECDVVGTCFEAITDVLFKAHQNGRGSLGRQALSDEVYTAHGYAQKTVDNTVGAMVQKREIVKPARGRVALAPATLQRLTSNRDLSLEGRNKEKTQSVTGDCSLPGTLPDAQIGNNELPTGNSPGSNQIPAPNSDLAEILPGEHGCTRQPGQSADDFVF